MSRNKSGNMAIMLGFATFLLGTASILTVSAIIPDQKSALDTWLVFASMFTGLGSVITFVLTLCWYYEYLHNE